MAKNHIQPAVLRMWRVALVVLFFPPAFVCSLFMQPYSFSWMLAMGCWLVLFLALYLLYLPAYYASLSFRLDTERVLLHSGVFYLRGRSVPLRSIQFAFAVQNPLARLFGLSTLVLVLAGGRLHVPGLSRQDAQTLASILPNAWNELA